MADWCHDGGERPLDLSTLSTAEKDQLILAFGRICGAKERRPGPGATTGGASGVGTDMPMDEASLLEQLRHHGTRKGNGAATKGAKVRLGRGLGLLRSGLVIGLVLVAALAFGLDFGIGWYQQRQIVQKRQAQLQLQQAAFADLFVELMNIAYEPDGKSYRLTLAMQNLVPEQPIYVMLSPIRVYEQSGLVWKEVPARAAEPERHGHQADRPI